MTTLAYKVVTIQMGGTRNQYEVARIENDLIYHARYNLKTRDQKVILYLISKLDPRNQKDFEEMTVSIKEIESILKSEKEERKKWGGLHSEMDQMIRRLLNLTIFFPSKFSINGKPVKGGINWFSSVIPYRDDEGVGRIEFLFSKRLKPFLLELNEYAQIPRSELAPMKSKYAIRMFQIFKADRDKNKKYRKVSSITYTLDELKGLLNIEGKYVQYRDLRRRVLDSIEQDINKCSISQRVKCTPVKEGRKVVGVTFHIYDRKKGQEIDITPDGGLQDQDDARIQDLSRAKKMAFDLLKEFGVYDGIILDKVIPSIKGSEILGYEDKFVEFAIEHFKKWSKQQKTKELATKTFVSWWVDKKIFDVEQDVWSQILENIVAYKQSLRSKNPEALANREVAVKMTYEEFETWYKSQKIEN